MIGFIIGVVVGASIGIIILAFCIAAKETNEDRKD